MEYFNKIICVTVEDLTGGNNPVMTKSNYDNLVKRHLVNIIRPGKGLDSYALIEYASLPGRFRIRFEETVGKPDELLKDQLIPETIRLNMDARSFFANYQFINGEYLPQEKQEEYTMNASILDQLIRELNDRSSFRKACGKQSTKLLWQTITGTVERFRENPGHTLPKNLSNLKEKINQYKKFGFEVLISGKFGNVNTVKITEEAGNLIIALKRCRVPVYNNEQIFAKYNLIATQKGWKPLKSINSLVTFLGRPEVEPLWYDAVYGEKAAKQLYMRKHKTALPEMRDALWYGDGTKLNLYYKAFEQGKGYVMKSTAVYEVIDSYSEMLLGYHISDTEDHVQQYHAFRMAIERAECKPFEIVTDNQGGQKNKATLEFFDSLCRVRRPSQPHNPQSKSIEAIFGRFQSQVLHQWFYFTGTNVTAKTGRPNVEFIEANIDKLPTLDELKEIYAQAREMWNGEREMLTTGELLTHPKSKDGKTRIEMYLNSVNPETQKIDQLDMIEMFWLTTKNPSTFTASGITIQVKNKEYTYEVLDEHNMPDMEFRRNHTGRQFFVQYDPDDMAQVRLYAKISGSVRYVATAHPYVEVHRAIQEQTHEETSFIRQMDVIIKNERIQWQVNAATLETEHGVAPEQHGYNRAAIKGINKKTVEALMGDIIVAPKKERRERVYVESYEKEMSNRTYDMVDQYDKL
jgi:hypothetical protein